MDNKTAFGVGFVVIGLILLDTLVLHSGLTLAGLRRLAELIEEMAFWR